VPLVVRWPGTIAAGTISNQIVSHHDWLPTFLAAGGEPDIKGKLLKGHSAAGKSCWKMVFMEQRCRGTLQVWAEPFTPLRVPKLFNLRTDPFERADTTSNTYWDWYVSKAYLIMAAQGIVADFLKSFREYPPRQKAASFTIDQAMEKMSESMSGAHR